MDEHGITSAFFAAVVRRAIDSGLTSDDHLSVDGTLIESHASIKSFKPAAPGSASGSAPGSAPEVLREATSMTKG